MPGFPAQVSRKQAVWLHSPAYYAVLFFQKLMQFLELLLKCLQANSAKSIALFSAATSTAPSSFQNLFTIKVMATFRKRYNNFI